MQTNPKYIFVYLVSHLALAASMLTKYRHYCKSQNLLKVWLSSDKIEDDALLVNSFDFWFNLRRYWNQYTENKAALWTTPGIKSFMLKGKVGCISKGRQLADGRPHLALHSVFSGQQKRHSRKMLKSEILSKSIWALVPRLTCNNTYFYFH